MSKKNTVSSNFRFAVWSVYLMNAMSSFSWYQTAGSLIRSQISKYTPHSKSFSLTYTKGFCIIFGEDFEGLHYIA